jgi:hypothetical protein
MSAYFRKLEIILGDVGIYEKLLLSLHAHKYMGIGLQNKLLT